MEIKRVKPLNYLEDIYNEVLSQDFPNLEFGGDGPLSDILIVSDYSGDRKEDTFYVYSLLITDMKEGAAYVSMMRKFRNSNPSLPDNSFFEFKNLRGDKLRQRLFPKFLKICNEINGLLVVFLIEKNCEWVGKTNNEILKKLKDLDLGNWTPSISEKMLTTFVLVSFLASKIPNRDKNLLWLSDRDTRIGDNENLRGKAFEVFKMVNKAFNSLYNNQYKNITLSNQFGKTSDEDLNSVVDVAAGFLLDVLDKRSDKTYHSLSSDYAKWFFLDQNRLMKRCFKIFKDNDRERILQIFGENDIKEYRK